MHKVSGGCHCGNISYMAEMTEALSEYIPCACDCKLCRSHGASYVSDNSGSLTVTIQRDEEVNQYRQGSRIADFHICKNCGVLTHVTYEENGVVFGSINARTSQNFASFGNAQVAHLTQQDDEQRIKRWKAIWFPNVQTTHENG